MKIHILNGPNLNLLGKREPSIYGDCNFEDFFQNLSKDFPHFELVYFQSNVEGELINILHSTEKEGSRGIILNAGGYTHTSVAIRDAISSIETPVIEVHISNLLSRENFRHESIIGAVCKGSIMGFGLDSYRLALHYFTNCLSVRQI